MRLASDTALLSQVCGPMPVLMRSAHGDSHCACPPNASVVTPPEAPAFASSGDTGTVEVPSLSAWPSAG